MTKRRSSTSKGSAPLLLGALALLALLLFAGGELFAFFTSDLGRVLTYRHVRLGNRAHIVRLVGKRVHAGLEKAGVVPSQTEEKVTGGSPALKWNVEMSRSGSPTQANAAITRELEAGGAVVLSGRERTREDGAFEVALVVGLPGFPTHEVVVTRPGVPTRARGEEEEPAAAPEIALVLFGLGDDAELDRSLLRHELPFALALSAASEGHEKLLREAKTSRREIVLLVPMEPEKYPSQNPGPGTLLVSMSPGRIESMTRGYIREAGAPLAVANYMGSLATQDEQFVGALYRALRKDGVSFVHVAPAPRSVCRNMASSEGVAYDEPDAYLDAETRPGRGKALERGWADAIDRATRQGNALVMMRATPASLAWLEKTLARTEPPFRLVAASRVLHRPAGK